MLVELRFAVVLRRTLASLFEGGGTAQAVTEGVSCNMAIY